MRRNDDRTFIVRTASLSRLGALKRAASVAGGLGSSAERTTEEAAAFVLAGSPRIVARNGGRRLRSIAAMLT